LRWRLHWDMGAFAVCLLLCAAMIRLSGGESDDSRGRPVARIVRVAWWFVLVATWVNFWQADLHRAQFRITLLSIPLAAVVALAIGLLSKGRRFLREPSSWSAAAAVGIATGLGLVWAMMVPRGHIGCTGVSTAYERTQCITLIALYLLGPAILAPSFSACFARPWWLRRADPPE